MSARDAAERAKLLRNWCYWNQVDKVTAALGSGLSATTVFADGKQPLHHAAMGDAVETCVLLLSRGAAVDAMDTAGARPLDYAVSNFHRAARVLLDAGARFDPASDLAAHLAANVCATGTDDEMLYLLERGVNGGATDVDGELLIHRAVRYGDQRKCELLLAYGADIHAVDQQGCNVVHVAAAWKRAAMFAWLENQGVDFHAADHSGQTALHHAALHNNTPEILALLGRNVDAQRENMRGTSAMDVMFKAQMRQGVMACLAVVPAFDAACDRLRAIKLQEQHLFELPASRLEAALRCDDRDVLLLAVEQMDASELETWTNDLTQAKVVFESEIQRARDNGFPANEPGQLCALVHAALARRSARETIEELVLEAHTGVRP